MSKKATKALNNPYYIARYNASKNNPNLTSREKTAEILNIDRTRLSRIELGMSVPYPEEVLAMADVYEIPELCNMYCSGECAIGRETVKPINADRPGSTDPSVPWIFSEDGEYHGATDQYHFRWNCR